MMKSGKWSGACRRLPAFRSKNAKRGIVGVRAAGMKILADRLRLHEAHGARPKSPQMNTDTRGHEKQIVVNL